MRFVSRAARPGLAALDGWLGWQAVASLRNSIRTCRAGNFLGGPLCPDCHDARFLHCCSWGGARRGWGQGTPGKAETPSHPAAAKGASPRVAAGRLEGPAARVAAREPNPVATPLALVAARSAALVEPQPRPALRATRPTWCLTRRLSATQPPQFRSRVRSTHTATDRHAPRQAH